MPIVINGSGTVTGVTNVGSASANTPVIMQDSGSNSNTVRAWVNFNGTGTIAIRASFNVSSITDNGTGDYTVNFTNAMPNANYSVSGTAAYWETPSGRGSIWFELAAQSTILTTSVRVQTTSTSSIFDCPFVGVQIFR